MISLAKLKNHSLAGVTLSMKNMFGIAPNSIYGDDGGNETAILGRSRLHRAGGGFGNHHKRNHEFTSLLPHEKQGDFPNEPGYRVPRVIVDLCAARPIHLAILDGIRSISGGEGWWSGGARMVEPGVLIAGLNPVSTDAVGMAVMGYPNPYAARGSSPFFVADNHIALAEQAGLGCADLSRIEVRGIPIEEAVCHYSTQENVHRIDD